jgi:hypothetical protein
VPDVASALRRQVKMIIIVRPRKLLTSGRYEDSSSCRQRPTAIVAQLGRDVALAKWPVTIALRLKKTAFAAAYAM